MSLQKGGIVMSRKNPVTNLYASANGIASFVIRESISGQFEAIGFIVAAKSILRFKDTDTAKTEYVLAGTFLSFGIAILCGLMARI